MTLKVTYDDGADLLFISTGERPLHGTDLEPDISVVAHYGSWDGYDIVALTVMFAASTLEPYFRPNGSDNSLGREGENTVASYDGETDTLLLGVSCDDPNMVTQAGEHMTAYWARDEWDEDDFVPTGVSLRGASKHLAPFFRLAEGVAG